MDKILIKLEDIELRLCGIEYILENIEKDTKSVAKHVPFVDKLSKIGTLTCVSSLNNIVSSINPMKYLPGNRRESITDLHLQK